MADNEHTRPSLGQPEVLSVQHSVGEPIPELPQPSEKGAQRMSCVCRQDARDVLPDAPAGAISIQNCEIREGEVATRISQALAEASH
jgi:hypothetical protein